MKMKVHVYFFLLLFNNAFFCDAQSEKKAVRKGNEYYKEKKFSEAEKSYSSALKEKPTYFKAGYNLANSQFKQGKYKEASEQYEVATSGTTSNDTLSMILHNRGTSLIKEKKYEDAVKVLKTALKIKPGDEDTRYNLAFAQKKLQQQNKNGGGGNNKDEQQKKKDNQEKKEGDKNKQQEKKQEEKKGNELNKEEAERMLDALKNNEKKLAKKRKIKPDKESENEKIEKDW